MAKQRQSGAFHFRLEAGDGEPVTGGTLHRATRSNFPALQGLAIQTFELQEGGIREPHTHPNAAQLDYCISGNARVGIAAPGEQAQLFDLEPVDITFVPQGFTHWIENAGTEPLRFLLVLSHDEPETNMMSDTGSNT